LGAGPLLERGPPPDVSTASRYEPSVLAGAAAAAAVPIARALVVETTRAFARSRDMTKGFEAALLACMDVIAAPTCELTARISPMRDAPMNVLAARTTLTVFIVLSLCRSLIVVEAGSQGAHDVLTPF
jgi:hypothetical protein